MAKNTKMEFDPRFIHPFPCLIAGPTGSGKSVFVSQLILAGEQMIQGAPERIVWCYGEYQPLYSELGVQVPHLEFVEGLDFNIDPTKRTLIIIDDLMSETVNDKRLTDLFCKKSHHQNTSVIFIVQNLFIQGKEMRNVTQNCHYMVLFKNPRDASIIGHLGKQMYPGKSKFIQEAFRDATKVPHGYLLIDLKQNTPEILRLRTDIFSPKVVVYAPKSL